MQSHLAPPAAPQPPPSRPAPAAAPVSPVAGGGGRGTRKKSRHLEDSLQAACVCWFRYQYSSLASLLFAIPNGGQRNPREGARLKAQGVTAGVPDLLLAVPNPSCHGLFLELKAGALAPRPNQREQLERLQEKGYAVAVIRSLPEFQTVVDKHLRF